MLGKEQQKANYETHNNYHGENNHNNNNNNNPFKLNPKAIML